MITMLVLGVAVVGVFLFLALLRNYSDARQRVV
jgi:Tfp pilus assembly protein PilV